VPQNALSLYQKGTAAAQKGNNKAAAEFFSQAVAAYPSFAIALSDLALEYMKLNQMDKAGETYEALLKLKPNDPMAHLNLGIVMFNKKKFEDAEMHLRKALELKNAGPTGHYYLGLTLISLKRYNEALPEFETTIANGGDNLALAHKFLGGLYMSAQRNKEAADELEKYLKLDPKAPDADRLKGTIKDLRDKEKKQ
jgi:tetratricopeptide (TPR) repeat protein